MGIYLSTYENFNKIDQYNDINNKTFYYLDENVEVFEKRGVQLELEEIADDIIQKIGDKKILKYKFNFNGKIHIVNIKIDNDLKQLGTCEETYLLGVKTIKLRELDKFVLIHELKHLLFKTQNKKVIHSNKKK